MCRIIPFMVFAFSVIGHRSYGQKSQTYIVPVYKTMSNLFELDVQVNGYPARFSFDSGASMVSISKDFYNYLSANGYLSKSDFKRKQQTILADGTLADVFVVNLKFIKIGNYEATNVETIVSSEKAPLLIGQNVIQRFSSFSMDNVNNQLVLTVNLSKEIALRKLRFIPVSTQAVNEISTIISNFRADFGVKITEISREVNIPTSPITLKRIMTKFTIRYFDKNTQQQAELLSSKLNAIGYSQGDITIENMMPYYSTSIPEYVEIWIK